jgi:orotate phosphoribosyltransferase
VTAGDREALRRLLLERSVRHGDFVLASGQRSTFYIDCRPTTMSAEGMVLVGRLGAAAIRGAGWHPRAVGGLTMGADPVAYAIAAASHGTDVQMDAFSVRKESKGHGTGRGIEGNFGVGFEVVIVEDVITTGGSAKKAIQAVEDAEREGARRPGGGGPGRGWEGDSRSGGQGSARPRKRRGPRCEMTGRRG